MFAKKFFSILLCLISVVSLFVPPVSSAEPSITRPENFVGIGNSSSLASLYAALSAVKEGRRREPVRIVQYGDSHTAADLMTATIRRNFERDFKSMTAQAKPGVIYDVVGINGARAVRLTSWSDRVFSGNFARRKPDLIVLAYGTNEVTDENWSIESYQRMFAGILRRLKRIAPEASLLIIAPPDRSVRVRGAWRSAARMSALIEAQRRAAIETGAAFWSAYAAMGGAGSMNRWVAEGLAQPDHVHLTVRGYARLGEMFYRDFINAYESRASVPARKQSSLNLVFFEVPVDDSNETVEQAESAEEIEFDGTLERGKTYRAEVAYDEKLRRWWPVVPLKIPFHHSVGVEWLNLSEFPELEAPEPEVRSLRFTFRVESKTVTRMTERRWSTIYGCRILRVEPAGGAESAGLNSSAQVST